MAGLGNTSGSQPTISALQSGLNEPAEGQQQNEQRRIQKETADVLIKVHGAMYSSAMIYNNAIILAGYAMFFGIWSYTKQFLPAWAMQASALLMGLSALAFVAFEIHKMMKVEKLAKAFGDVININNDASKFAEALQKYQHAANELQIKLFQQQAPVFIFTVIAGFGASLILVGFFVLNLFQIVI